MSLESATKISELVDTNPTGTDPKSQGDDHIRLIKSVLKADALVKADLPSGAIMDFAMNSVPANWLQCNGAAVSRTTYSKLFTAIGTTWGAGDGTTTFNLPDFRGYFRRGVGTNVDGTAAGAFAAKQADMVGPHSHTLAATVPTTSSGGATWQNGASPTLGAITSTGNNTGTETRPKNIAFMTCIKI